MRPRLQRVFWALLRIYILLVVSVYFLQGRLLYLRSANSAAVTQQQAADARLSYWPNAAKYQALLRTPPLDTINGTVVLFHGNAGTAQDRAFYATQFEQCGLRTLLVEYSGYGARDTDVALRQAEQAQMGVVSGALLITPWDELANVANRRFWFLPARLILADSYNSVVALKDFHGPLLVVRATRDEIIPASSTLALFNSFSGPKQIFNVPDGHNNWSENIPDSWWPQLCSNMLMLGVLPRQHVLMHAKIALKPKL